MFLVVTRNFPPDIGGIQSLMGGLSKSLVNHGPVKVFAYEFPNSKLYDKNSTINIERVKGVKIFRKFRKSRLVNSFIANNQNIRAILTDHWKSLELLNTENTKKYKTFCLIHSKEINHELGSSLNKRLLKSIDKTDLVIANSNFTKKLATDLGVDPKKIKIIFPGIDVPKPVEEKFKTEAKKIYNESFPKIITVARLDKRKGHEKILMSLKNLKVKFPKIKYVSVGFGEEQENLKKLSRELKIDNDVLFLDKIDEDLKNALVSVSNLFLMPTVFYKKSVEGFGISYIEAGSYGIGSIGGKHGGASDAIKHNETGLICDGTNLNSVYDAVNLFFDNDNYKRFGNGAKKFSENFHWNKIIKQYLELI